VEDTDIEIDDVEEDDSTDETDESDSTSTSESTDESHTDDDAGGNTDADDKKSVTEPAIYLMSEALQQRLTKVTLKHRVSSIGKE
jgi:hypothetical protein